MPDLEDEDSDALPENHHDVFLNRPNLSGEPAIIYLLSSNKFEDWDDDTVLEAANILKEAGAAVGTCNMQGNTVIHCAAERGSLKVMEAVLEWSKEEKYCFDVNVQNMEGSEYTDGTTFCSS